MNEILIDFYKAYSFIWAVVGTIWMVSAWVNPKWVRKMTKVMSSPDPDLDLKCRNLLDDLEAAERKTDKTLAKTNKTLANLEATQEEMRAKREIEKNVDFIDWAEQTGFAYNHPYRMKEAGKNIQKAEKVLGKSLSETFPNEPYREFVNPESAYEHDSPEGKAYRDLYDARAYLSWGRSGRFFEVHAGEEAKTMFKLKRATKEADRLGLLKSAEDSMQPSVDIKIPIMGEPGEGEWCLMGVPMDTLNYPPETITFRHTDAMRISYMYSKGLWKSDVTDDDAYGDTKANVTFKGAEEASYTAGNQDHEIAQSLIKTYLEHVLGKRLSQVRFEELAELCQDPKRECSGMHFSDSVREMLDKKKVTVDENNAETYGHRVMKISFSKRYDGCFRTNGSYIECMVDNVVVGTITCYYDDDDDSVTQTFEWTLDSDDDDYRFWMDYATKEHHEYFVKNHKEEFIRDMKNSKEQYERDHKELYERWPLDALGARPIVLRILHAKRAELPHCYASLMVHAIQEYACVLQYGWGRVEPCIWRRGYAQDDNRYHTQGRGRQGRRQSNAIRYP